MERAKELFLKYNGNHFHMDREGEGAEYDTYHVSKETEEMWTEEFVSSFLGSKLQGREALRTYSTATELLKSERKDGNWDTCLYYPLRTEDLDDVTILFMLPAGFRMAERAVKKHRFSREERDRYLNELDNYISQTQDRVKKGMLSRTADYVMQDFADPAYVEEYLNDLKKKWLDLFI